MPLKIMVGNPGAHWWDGRLAALVELRRKPGNLNRFFSDEECLLSMEVDLPVLWGLEPLTELAAHVALGGDLETAPVFSGRDDRVASSEYIDIADQGSSQGRLPYFHLVRAGSEAYLPVEEAVLHGSVDSFWECGLGSTMELERELDSLLEQLRGGVPREHAMPRLWMELKRAPITEPPGGRRVEIYSALALREACRVARDSQQLLFFAPYYVPKPDGLEFSFFDQACWGMNVFDGVEIAEDGHAVLFFTAGGYRYRVPVEYLQAWYPDDSALKESDGGEMEIRSVSVTDHGSTAILSLASGIEIEVYVDHVLVHCEPDYHGFELGQPWKTRKCERLYRKLGPFREVPELGDGGVVAST